MTFDWRINTVNTQKEEEVDLNDISDIEIESDSIPYNYYRFYIAPPLVTTQSEYTRLIIINRWLWMTDDSSLRSIYKPLLAELEQKGFKEISPGVIITKRDTDNAIQTLRETGLVEETSTLNSPLKYIKK